MSAPVDLAAALAARFPPELVEPLSARAHRTESPAGTQLLRAGDVARRVWFLARGAVRMCYYRDAREHICDLFLEGDFVTDYTSLIAGTPARAYLVTCEPCLTASFSQSDLAALEAAHPLATARAMRSVAEALASDFGRRIASTLMDSPAERYEALRRERPAWFGRFPQYMLASYLGITPEALSRLRRRLGKPSSTPPRHGGA